MAMSRADLKNLPSPDARSITAGGVLPLRLGGGASKMGMSRLPGYLFTAAIVTAVACGGRDVAPEDARDLPEVDPAARAEHEAALGILESGGEDAPERAAQRFEAAVAIDPMFWEGWHNLASLELRRGQPAAAERAFTEALDIRSSHGPSRLGRAEARRRGGDVRGALADYEALFDRRPDDLRAATRLVSLLREARRYEDAIAAIRRYLREAGADAEIYVQLGLVYHAQERSELAELVLEQAIELDEGSAAAHNALALVHLRRGDDQRAFDLFDRASALDPDDLDARFNKAGVLLDAGDYEAGAAELEAVLAQSPDDFDARVALGVGLRGSQDLDGAREVWEEVVRDAPPTHAARSDALYNLAVLELDFNMDMEAGSKALDRYLQDAPSDHPKRAEAESRREELRF